MTNFLQALIPARFEKGMEADGFLRLFVSKRLIQGAATAILSVFLPIFLYEVSGGLFIIVGAYYAAASLLYVLFLAPGMKAVNKIGFSHALILGGVFSVILNVFLFFINEANLPILLPFILISIVGYWIFHWVPFHVDFALFTTHKSRSRQVSLSLATTAFMGVLGPLLAGFIITTAGYKALFGFAIVLLTAATISYALVPETNTHFSWSLKKTWREFFNRDHRNIVVGEFASGAETVVNLIVWPIFLYEILSGDLLEIGAVSTVVVAVTIVVQLFMGKYLDQHNGSLKNTLKVGSGLYAVGWIIKIFVLSTLQVFLIGLYHNVVRIFTRTPFVSIMYDMSAEQGKYVDEFTVLREMAQHLGRASSLIAIAFLSIFIPIAWTFVIAAAASIALNLVYYTKRS